MSEALSVILNFGFSKLKLNRIEAIHYEGNTASGRVMEKCGMIYKGRQIKKANFKGCYHDVIHYDISRQEWKVQNFGERQKGNIFIKFIHDNLLEGLKKWKASMIF